MRHLNYSHLLYFWTVARDGSIAKASEALHLTPQTISGQLKLLEEAVGERLFNRVGRRLVLSDTGRLVFQYADEIFALGTELVQVLRGHVSTTPETLTLGITDSVPKLVAYRMIEPALAMAKEIRVICLEGKLSELLADLAVHKLDLVLSDGPLPTGLNVRAYNHLLGESDLAFFASRTMTKRLVKGFPKSLHDTPMLLPAHRAPLRRDLDEWFESLQIRPRILAEFDDTALLKAFGQAGVGVFPGPLVMAKEISEMYRVQLVGHTNLIRERFFAISPERRIKHPAVIKISDRAKQAIFV